MLLVKVNKVESMAESSELVRVYVMAHGSERVKSGIVIDLEASVIV